MTNSHNAATVPTQFIDVSGRHFAYRTIGEGIPLLLCLRFRGVMDMWDPAFLDALARKFRVIIFDYSGLGQSSGEANYDPKALAYDAIDLANAMQLKKFVIGGWSLGGMAAQIAATLIPDRISHLILLGTTPPGPVSRPTEPIFFERALKFDYDLEDEIILFFEPKSERSRMAAKASHDRIASRTTDRSPAIQEKVYTELLQAVPNEEGELFCDEGYADFLASTSIPILVISGDHEIVFPASNWSDLVGQWRSLHLTIIPQAGHGPHHQEPAYCAELISSFAVNIRS
jgi:pimeloyl-ACP methyl ester carboxylesterase